MLYRLSAGTIALSIVLAGCGGTSTSASMPRNVPMPENAKNPIVLAYESDSATVSQVVDAISSALSTQGIPTFRVDPQSGIIETQWIDMGGWDPTGGAKAYPPAERNVLLLFQVGEAKDQDGKSLGTGIVEWAYYQPSPAEARARPQTYRVEVPTQHPGYMFLLRVNEMVSNDLTIKGIPNRQIQVTGN